MNVVWNELPVFFSASKLHVHKLTRFFEMVRPQHPEEMRENHRP